MIRALTRHWPPLLIWPDEEARPAPPRWYESIWLWLGLALLGVLPFLLSPLPPLSDLHNHMGRYHVMLEHARSPFLQRYYSFGWDLIPNLGQDLLMVPFGMLFGVERGALILSAAIPPATILGFRSLSLAVHGRVQPVALLAVPFAMSFTYLYGFMNYHTGLVIVLWTMVFWHRARSWRGPYRIAALALISMITWVCHFSAWAILLIAIGSFELVKAIRALGWRPLAIVASVMATIGPMLLPGLITLSRLSLGGPDRPSVGGYSWKLNSLAYPLRDESLILDLASLAIIAAIPAVLLLLGKLRFDSGLGLGAVIMFALFCALPTDLMGGFYADLRLLPVAWFCGLIACRGEAAPPRWTSAVALAAVALFAGRMAVTTQAWMVRGASLEADLQALRHVPRGARIAELSPLRTCGSWPSLGVHHLSGLAIVRRDAFTTTEWDIPGQQLMQPTYLRGSPYNTIVLLKSEKEDCSGQTADEWLAKLPRDKFDFVWLFMVEAPPATRDWLTPVHRGPHGTLYAVRR